MTLLSVYTVGVLCNTTLTTTLRFFYCVATACNATHGLAIETLSICSSVYNSPRKFD